MAREVALRPTRTAAEGSQGRSAARRPHKRPTRWASQPCVSMTLVPPGRVPYPLVTADHAHDDACAHFDVWRLPHALRAVDGVVIHALASTIRQVIQ